MFCITYFTFNTWIHNISSTDRQNWKAVFTGWIKHENKSDCFVFCIQNVLCRFFLFSLFFHDWLDDFMCKGFNRLSCWAYYVRVSVPYSKSVFLVLVFGSQMFVISNSCTKLPEHCDIFSMRIFISASSERLLVPGEPQVAKRLTTSRGTIFCRLWLIGARRKGCVISIQETVNKVLAVLC